MPQPIGNNKVRLPSNSTRTFTAEDGTVIEEKKTDYRRENLADCLDDFPDDIKKIVAPFI
jgi:hypothetical protein